MSSATSAKLVAPAVAGTAPVAVAPAIRADLVASAAPAIRPDGHLVHAELTREVIGAAIEVHRVLGAGLLESAYQQALSREFELRRLPFERELALPLAYKSVDLDCGYRIDLVVAGRVVVEVKAVRSLLPVREAQLLTYMRLGGYPVGLLVNFHVRVLRAGIVRRVL